MSEELRKGILKPIRIDGKAPPLTEEEERRLNEKFEKMIDSMLASKNEYEKKNGIG